MKSLKIVNNKYTQIQLLILDTLTLLLKLIVLRTLLSLNLCAPTVFFMLNFRLFLCKTSSTAVL